MMLFATLSPGTLLMIGGCLGFVLGVFFASLVTAHQRQKEPL